MKIFIFNMSVTKYSKINKFSNIIKYSNVNKMYSKYANIKISK